jgi:hypothetical protein
MNQQSFSTMRFHQAELTILIRGSTGGEIRQKGNLVQNLAQKRNPIEEPSQRGFDGGYLITSRSIAFGSPVASHYAQSNSITSEQQNLIRTSIPPWLRAAVRKFKSDTVSPKIWLEVEYQEDRGHPQLSNGYLLALIRSTV